MCSQVTLWNCEAWKAEHAPPSHSCSSGAWWRGASLSKRWLNQVLLDTLITMDLTPDILEVTLLKSHSPRFKFLSCRCFLCGLGWASCSIWSSGSSSNRWKDLDEEPPLIHAHEPYERCCLVSSAFGHCTFSVREVGSKWAWLHFTDEMTEVEWARRYSHYLLCQVLKFPLRNIL